MNSKEIISKMDDKTRSLRIELKNTNESIMKIVDSYDDLEDRFPYESDEGYKSLRITQAYLEGQIKALEQSINLIYDSKSEMDRMVEGGK